MIGAAPMLSFGHQVRASAAVTGRGVGLVLAAAGLSLLARNALQRWVAVSARWSGAVCPYCKAPLVRSHRTKFQKVITGVAGLPLWRYRCSSPKCHWQGLRRRLAG